MRKITKKDLTAALHTSSPIIVTFVVLGIGYGILSVVIGTALYMFLVQSVF